MIFRTVVLLLLTLMVLTHPSSAISVVSGDNVIITRETGDILLSGGRVTVLAPIKGDLILAGGDVVLNAPVSGDVIAAGGSVNILSDVGGKVIAAGGEITIGGAVKKFALMAGGSINIEKDARIGNDVFAAGGQIKNDGLIKGNLTAIGGEYTGEGTVMGHERFQRAELLPPYFFEIAKAGFLILGLLLVYLTPFMLESGYGRMAGGIRAVIKTMIAGGIGIAVSMAAGFALMFSVVGISVGLFLITSSVLVLLISNLMVSYSIGKYLISGKTSSKYLYMVAGFASLYVITKLPYVGDMMLLISTCLGFGTVIYMLLETERRKMLDDVHENI